MATRTSVAAKNAPSARLEKAELLDMCRLMLLSRRIDDREIQLKRQNKIFFQISGAGHEAVLVAASKVFRAGYDWFYTYYRDRALCLGLGMTATEQLLSAVAAADDPNSGGRQMPSHWGHKDLNIVSASSPTGTQFLQAVGCAEAWLRSSRVPGIATAETPFHGDEVVFCSTGDGTTSQGEFWESMNTACNLKLPVVYLVEDNGYAISVPVEVNTAGGSISKLLVGFPDLYIQEVDGCDVRASYDALTRAVDYCRQRKGPALVHAKVIRPYSHSLSDDEINYRTPAEREADAERDPVTTFPRWLVAQGIATEAEIERIRATVAEEVDVATDTALASPQPALDTIYNFVYSPDVDPTSEQFDTEDDPQFTGEPTTMVDLLNGCLKDEMARDPRIVVFGQDVADVSREAAYRRREGQGRGVQGDLGAAEAVRQRPGVQLAAGRGQHRRPRHRDGHAGHEAGRRNPVLRLHLDRVHAAARRARPHALAVQQRLQLAGGGPRHLRRVPQGRVGLSLADRRGDLHRRARASGWSARRRRSTPTACFAPPSAARIRSSSSSTSTSTARPTTRRPIPAPTS